MSITQVMTKERLMAAAPSIFAEEPFGIRAKNYNFIPTYKILSDLESSGWLPVSAKENRVRTEGMQGYQKHMIRLRNYHEQVKDRLDIGDIILEMILTNSHNAGSAFEFMLGLFRCICSNQAVVSEGSFQNARIIHTSYEAKQVEVLCKDVTEKAPALISDIDKLRAIDLTQDERIAYGRAAKALRFEDPDNVNTALVIAPRRRADLGNTLWNTYNTVQENLLKGGVGYTATNERGQRKYRHSREVKAIDGSIKLNQALWTLTMEMKKLKELQNA